MPLTGSVALTIVAALLVVVGLIGVVVPVLPGLVLVVGGIGLWAVSRHDAVGWTVLAVAVALVVAGSVLKYLLPGRRMRDAGVPGRTLVLGGVLGAEPSYVRTSAPTHTAAGWSILIELAAGLLATAVWVGALVLT